MTPNSPEPVEGAKQLRGIRGYATPENFEIVHYQKCDFMYIFGGGSFMEIELFMIVKLDIASSAIFTYFLLKRLSL